ncbi:MAG: hypothetical protein U0136_19135 [Bdellovibrionota bacterium]
MGRRFSAGSWIADTLTERTSIACGSGRSAALAMAIIAERGKCSRLLTNSALCAQLASRIPITLVAREIDALDLTCFAPSHPAVNAHMGIQVGIHAIRTVTPDGRILIRDGASIGMKRFLACASDRLFLLTSPAGLAKTDGVEVGNLQDFAARKVRVTVVIGRGPLCCDRVPRAVELMGSFESLSNRFPNMEVWMA